MADSEGSVPCHSRECDPPGGPAGLSADACERGCDDLTLLIGAAPTRVVPLIAAATPCMAPFFSMLAPDHAPAVAGVDGASVPPNAELLGSCVLRI